jgi:hypothetical protein
MKNFELIKDLQQQLESVEKTLGRSGSTTREDRLSQALNRTDELVENLKSLAHRIQQWQKSSTRQTENTRSFLENKEHVSHSTFSAQGQPGPRHPVVGSRTRWKIENSQSALSSKKDNHDRGNLEGAREDQSTETFNESGIQSDKDATESARQAPVRDADGSGAVNFGDSRLPAPFPNDDEMLKQLAREYELRIREAQSIAPHLKGEDALAYQLQNMIDRMQQLRNTKFLVDPPELEKLGEHILDGLYQFEMQLSRNLQQVLFKDSLQFDKDEDVPALYRSQVEKYFKALSQK